MFAGTVSSATRRVSPSGEPMIWPSIVTLLSAASMPRIVT